MAIRFGAMGGGVCVGAMTAPTGPSVSSCTAITTLGTIRTRNARMVCANRLVIRSVSGTALCYFSTANFVRLFTFD